MTSPVTVEVFVGPLFRGRNGQPVAVQSAFKNYVIPLLNGDFPSLSVLVAVRSANRDMRGAVYISGACSARAARLLAVKVRTVVKSYLTGWLLTNGYLSV